MISGISSKILKSDNRLRQLLIMTLVVAFVAIALGAYTRLVDGGLGCPDWPGCFGQVTVPHSSKGLAMANQAFPEMPVEPLKAWSEMIHRYFAGIYGTLVMICSIWAFQRSVSRSIRYAALTLVALVVFQAILGMWTVTWLLLPLVVMGHLIGGFGITALLWHLYLCQQSSKRFPVPSWVKPLYITMLTALVFQLILGGWTSSNYASLICVDFPTCQGSWWPEASYREAFHFFAPIGHNYQGGVMSSAGRVAIQMAHRLGAVILTFILLGGGYAFRTLENKALQKTVVWFWILYGFQILWGSLNVLWQLPLMIALLHNITAIILLLVLIKIGHLLWPQESDT